MNSILFIVVLANFIKIVKIKNKNAAVPKPYNFVLKKSNI